MPTRCSLVPRLPRDAWVVLAGDTVSAIGSGMTLPFLLVYLTGVRGLDLSVAGLAVAAVALTGFLGNPTGGWLADQIGAKSTLCGGLIVAAGGAFLIALVREPVDAFVATSVLGLGVSVVVPAQDALLASVVRPHERSSVFAVRNATLNLGYGVGSLVAALIADLSSAASFVTLYVIDGLSFLVFVPIFVRMLPRAARSLQGAERSRANELDGYPTVFRDMVFLRFWVLVALLVTVGFAQTQAAFPVYAVTTGGVGASTLAIAFAANTFTILALQLVVLRRMEARRRTTGIILACVCWAAAWALTFGVGTLGGGSVAIVGFIVAMVVFALGETLLAPSQAALANDLAPDHLRGRYNGLYTLAWTTGLTIGPALAALALDVGNAAVLFGVLIAACGVAAAMAAALARHLPPSANTIGDSALLGSESP